MAFQLSPGVEIKEFDLTSVIPTIATTPAGYVGLFQWGPVDQKVLIDSEKKLKDVFGKPFRSTTDVFYSIDWFVASNFLSYGGSLTVVRANQDDSHTATDCAAGITIKILNKEDYEKQSIVGTIGANCEWRFAAKYPGSLGNSLKVIVIDDAEYGSTDETTVFYDTWKDKLGVPGTSDYAANLTGCAGPGQCGGSGQLPCCVVNDELHIIVIDELGLISGQKGTVLEVYPNLSKASDAKSSDGVSIYYRNVINNKSQYVWVGEHPGASGANQSSPAGFYVSCPTCRSWGSEVAYNSSTGIAIPYQQLYSKEYRMVGLGQTLPVQDADKNDIFTLKADTFENHFSNTEEVDVSLLIAGHMNSSNAKRVIEIASQRQDCIAFVSAAPLDLIENSGTGTTADGEMFTVLQTYRNALGSSSYGVMDGNAKYQYDRYNDRFIYVPLCGDTAGCCVRTDNTKEPWYSPAGYDRGRINNIVKLVWNPSKDYRDKLYSININPVVSFQGSGAILFGDKTLQIKPSAFDRINVRRLFNVLEKTIATAAKFQLFEFNDSFTRAQFRQLVEPFLREVQGKRGVTSYAIICDESNNTASIIDQNQFVADIFVAPSRSINFIRLNFIATPTGVQFAEFGG